MRARLGFKMKGFGDKAMEVWRQSQGKFYGYVVAEPLPSDILDLVSALHWEEIFAKDTVEVPSRQTHRQDQ